MSTKNSFDTFFFTSNLTNYVCPGFSTITCLPPNACARDIRTGASYCCDAKEAGNANMGRVCWTLGTSCANDGSTKLCGNGDNPWCCLDKTESCTGTSGQRNVCWNTAHDTLSDIDRQVLNDTYSSLSSARPVVSSWTFDPATLIAATQTTSSGSSGSVTSTSVTATSSGPPPATSSSSPPSQQLSGGAIGGIVVGVVAILALAVGLGVFFSRRRKQQKIVTEIPGESMYRDDSAVKAELPSHSPPQELSTEPRLAELEGSR